MHLRGSWPTSRFSLGGQGGEFSPGGAGIGFTPIQQIPANIVTGTSSDDDDAWWEKLFKIGGRVMDSLPDFKMPLPTVPTFPADPGYPLYYPDLSRIPTIPTAPSTDWVMPAMMVGLAVMLFSGNGKRRRR